MQIESKQTQLSYVAPGGRLAPDLVVQVSPQRPRLYQGSEENEQALRGGMWGEEHTGGGERGG